MISNEQSSRSRSGITASIPSTVSADHSIFLYTRKIFSESSAERANEAGLDWVGLLSERQFSDHLTVAFEAFEVFFLDGVLHDLLRDNLPLVLALSSGVMTRTRARVSSANSSGGIGHSSSILATKLRRGAKDLSLRHNWSSATGEKDLDVDARLTWSVSSNVASLMMSRMTSLGRQQ